jgi:plasmid maintenance system antidote protein VapI
MRKSDEQKQAEAVSKRLKELIEELGVNQTEFAAAIGTTQNTINAYFTNRRQLTEGMAAKIGLKYGINPHWLISGEGEKYASGEVGELQRQNQLKQIAALRATIKTALEQLEDLENEVRK